MMRLIDADDAKRTYTQDMFDTEEDFERVNDVLDYAPTVDAVVVTWRKDCSYGERRVDHLALEAETTQIIDGCCTACGALMDCCEAAEYKYCPYCAKRIV